MVLGGKKLSLDVLRRLPKADLHCHLDGAIRVSTLIELAEEQGVDLPTFDEAALRDIISVGLDCPSLEEYLVGFELTGRVLQKQYAITRVFFEVCEDMYLDGVKYLEIRFSPILHTREDLGISQVMEAVCEGLTMAESAFRMNVRIIVCGMRQYDPQITTKLAEIAWRYRHKGVVGFDLAGPELGFSSKMHQDAFDIVRRKCLNCTLHSGEGDGWESIMDSVRFCGAQRIGHGVRLTENEDLMKFIVDRRIAIESCVTSNIQTKAVKSLEDHPFKLFLERGIKIIPCTDNPTMSGVTLSSEYELIQNTFDIGVEDIIRLIDNGFSAAFLENHVRRRLRAEAMHCALSILHEEGHDLQPILSSLRTTYESFWTEEEFDVDSIINPSVPRKYWQGHTNPPITADVISLIPKADLNVRLDGSNSLQFALNELKLAGIDPSTIVHFPVTCVQDILDRLYVDQHTINAKATKKIRHLVNRALQSREQLERGMREIFEIAAKDNVIYMELAVRPRGHCMDGLTIDEVMDIVLESRNLLMKEYPVKCSIVVYCNVTTDDAMNIHESAKLAVRNKDRGVVGFAFYRDEITTEAIRYLDSTIRLIKDNNMHLIAAAGKSDVHSISEAVGCGATRISGAYVVHENPGIMNFLADTGIAIETGLTNALVQSTGKLRQVSKSPIRLFLDYDLRVSICSFHSVISMPRNLLLERVVQNCSMDICDLLKLTGNGFRNSLVGYEERISMFREFENTCAERLRPLGFDFLKKKVFIPRPRAVPSILPPKSPGPSEKGSR